MKKVLFTFMAITMLLLLPGCSKNNDGYGRLVIKVTDAPFPVSMIESATVVITKVEIRKAGDGISDGSPFQVVWEGSKEINLLDLRNGVVDELASLDIPAGEYDLVRLYVDEAGLKVKEGEDFSVKVPSGQQTGIKIFINPVLVVEGGLSAELILDFDLEDSFVLKGNMDSPAGIKGFNFKPVVRAANNSIAGRIEGIVSDKDDLAIQDASVMLVVEEDTLKTLSDENGKYAFIGIDPGTYPMLAAKETYDTTLVDEVRVVAGNRTIQDFILNLAEVE